MTVEQEDLDLPAWQRETIFPLKPVEGPYGVVLKNEQVAVFSSFEDLRAQLRKWREPVYLIWTPAQPRCFPPEEEPRLLSVLRKRKATQADDDWNRSRFRALVLILPITYFLWLALSRGQLMYSQELGLVGVLWFIFGGIPAYEAWKHRRRAICLSEENLANEAQEVRFEIWLDQQKIPFTKILLGILVGVYLLQVQAGLVVSGGWLKSIWHPLEIWNGHANTAGVLAAGLVKSYEGIGYFNGEWWRLLTGPMLHGLLIHIVMNGAGLLYLGRRTEVLASWPHLLLVYLSSLLVGGIASAHGLPHQASVGASGGIMGLLGFLLVFEALHGRLVPKRSSRRLAAALVFTFLIGFAGYTLIDNWAHAGGLLAGMAYAAIVFPKSSSVHRPKANGLDQVLGIIAAILLFGGVGLAVVKITGSI